MPPRSVVALVAVVLLVAGCSSGDDDGRSTPVAGATIDVTLNDEGCHPRSIATFAGPTTFHVTNKGSAAVTRFEILEGAKVVGRVRKLAPGAEGDLAVILREGSYTTKCPGGSSFDAGTLKVTAS